MGKEALGIMTGLAQAPYNIGKTVLETGKGLAEAARPGYAGTPIADFTNIAASLKGKQEPYLGEYLKTGLMQTPQVMAEMGK
jgi:hypothetical protein